MPNEGDIVRNKRTGETAVWQGGRPVPINGGAPAAALAAGPVFGAPRLPPPPPPPPTSLQIEDQEMERERLRLAQEAQAQGASRDTLLNRLTELQVREGEAKLAEEQKAAEARGSAYDAAKDKLTRLIQQMNRVGIDANDNGGFMETGTSGSIARSVLPEGTPGADLSASLSTIRANFAFDALQAMRDASKTGGALGAITEQELKLLQDSVANMDPNQSHTQFLLNLADAKKAYLDKLRAIDPAAADQLERDPGPFRDEQGTLGFRYIREDDEAAAGLTGGGAPGGGNGGGPGMFSGDYSLPSLTTGVAQGLGDIVETGGDLLGIVGNPVNQAINWATGSNLSTDLGTALREEIGLPDNPNRIASAINKGAVGALTGSLASRGLATIAAPGGVAQNALATVGASPIRDTVAGAGAGVGMVAGDASGIPGGGVAGALVGGLAGYGGASALANLGQPRQANALLQGADDLGITMLPADVGGTGTRMATGAFGRTLGGIPLAEGSEKAIASAGAGRNRVAQRIGDATDDAGAGQAARSGFKSFEKNSAARMEQIVESIPVSADAPVRLDNTRNALTEITRGFASNPQLSKLWANYPKLRASLEALTPNDVSAGGRQEFMRVSSELQDAQIQLGQLRSSPSTTPEQLGAAQSRVATLQQNLQRAQREASREPVGGELSWQDMKRFRSIVGEIVGQPGIARDGSDIAALRKLYAALSADMEATAGATSSRALSQFRRANQYWRGRESRIDEVFSTLFGQANGRSDEAVFRQINNWAKREGGDFSRLARTIRSMPEDEANTIRATVVQRMGWAKPARQEGASEDVFSPAEFATQWHGLSSRAKSVLFPKREHRQDLEKLANVMDNMKQANQFANFSNTSLGANLTAQSVLAYANPLVAAALAGSQFAAGKLLASPRFARWLASAPSPRMGSAVRKWTENLGVIASREPALAMDIRSIQDTVGRAVNENVGRSGSLAASPNQRPDEEKRR